ncbi:hypothetical protein [Thermodesulfatator atlanticus]|uniref:hypothetical protein n=1 Tax=Thermodesulfatator atlanticus TaxID=501497 RepID=UPI0003B72CCD|nr:hypothetical protein [Thermodesulfatator atlanticus]
MKENVLFSLVGTQVLGTLNPATALFKSFAPPEETLCVLMPTQRTRPQAETIAEELKRLYPGLALKVHEVSSSIRGENSSSAIIEKELETKTYERIFYNAAGGLNYLTACLAGKLYASFPERLFLLYPENHRVLLFTPEAIREKSYQKVKKLYPQTYSLEEFLKLQGIEAEVIVPPELTGAAKKLFDKLLKYLKEAAQEYQLFGELIVKSFLENAKGLKVRASSNEEILFERAFINSGNNFCVMKIITSSQEKGKTKDEAREVLNFAFIREKAGEAFHQAMLVLTNDRSVHERLVPESRRKIKILNIYDKMEEKHLEAVKTQIKKYFFPNNFKFFKLSLILHDQEDLKRFNRHLLLFMGREVEPVFKAILAHNPEVAWLFFDKQSGEVGYPRDPKTLLGRLSRQKDEIEKETGIRLRFVGVDFYGSGVLSFPRPKGEVEVNITSGTKSQAIFLTLWAREHGASVYSIDNQKHQIAHLEGDERRDIPEVPLKWLLAIAGESEYQLITEAFPPEELLDPQVLKNGEAFVEKVSRLGKDYRERGELWEKVAGALIARGLNTDVYVNVKLGVFQKEEKTFHRTEIDLCFRYEGELYVVSCKYLKDLENIASLANEIEAMGQGLSRFALPLIAWSNYWEEEPNWIEIARGRKVPVVGIPILKDPEKLKKVLKELKDLRKRT